MNDKCGVTIQDVESYEFSHRIAADHGHGVNKTLDAIVKGRSVRYRVMDHRIEVATTVDVRDAVETYNLI